MGRLRGKDIRHFSAVLLQRHARYLLFYSFEDQKCMNNKARNLRILQRYPTLPKKHVGKRHWNLRRRNRQQHRLEAGYPAKMIGFPWTKRNVARKVKLCYTLSKHRVIAPDCFLPPRGIKRLFKQSCQGWQWFHAAAMFCARTKLAFNGCTRMYNRWKWFKCLPNLLILR